MYIKYILMGIKMYRILYKNRQ